MNERTKVFTEHEERAKNSCWSGTNYFYSVSGLLDIHFYFSALKFTLQNEIYHLLWSKVEYLSFERTHNSVLHIFDWWIDSILLKSFEMFTTKKKQMLSQVNINSNNNNQFMWIVKSLWENSNVELLNIILQSTTILLYMIYLAVGTFALFFMIQMRNGNIREMWNSDKN